MHIDSGEFLAVLDDALDALERNEIGQREKEEVLPDLSLLQWTTSFSPLRYISSILWASI